MYFWVCICNSLLSRPLDQTSFLNFFQFVCAGFSNSADCSSKLMTFHSSAIRNCLVLCSSLSYDIFSSFMKEQIFFLSVISWIHCCCVSFLGLFSLAGSRFLRRSQSRNRAGFLYESLLKPDKLLASVSSTYIPVRTEKHQFCIFYIHGMDQNSLMRSEHCQSQQPPCHPQAHLRQLATVHPKMHRVPLQPGTGSR